MAILSLGCGVRIPSGERLESIHPTSPPDHRPSHGRLPRSCVPARTSGRMRVAPRASPCAIARQRASSGRSISASHLPSLRMTVPEFDLAAVRARIPILAHAIPMNNCSQAPLTDVTRGAAERYLESWNRRGMDWDAWMAEVDVARGAFARMINASPDEVAVVSSVSQATSAIATALRFDGGRDTVVASAMEFPDRGACVAGAGAARGARAVGRAARRPDPARRLRGGDRRADGGRLVGACVLPERGAAGRGGDRPRSRGSAARSASSMPTNR